MPVWAVGHLPTLDGPAHVYNSWVLLQHGNEEEYPLFRRYYEIDGRPLPNWLGHAALALLMSFVEPPAAEKVLVSGYVVLFLAAAVYAAGAAGAAGAVDPERRWLGLLAFPFVFHQPFLLGFYNFSYSLALWLLAIGFWWRRRASPDAGLAVGINLLLLLCWFSHIVSLVLALFSLGILWLATLRRATWKRHLLHVAILAPQAVLPLWFLAAEGSEAGGQARSLALRAASLLRLDALAHFGGPRRWIATAVAAVFLLLIVLTLGRGGRLRLGLREEDGFLLLSLALAGVYLFGPTEMSGGSILLPRLSLYPWLALLPWLSPRLPGLARAALVGGLAALTLAQAACVLQVYRRLDAGTREFLAGTEAIPPDSRVLPLVFDRGPSQVYWHLFGYAALEKGLLDWTNYEAGTTLFPVRFRPAAFVRGRLLARAKPEKVDLGAVREVDAVYTWKMPPGSRQAMELDRGWRLVSVRGDARVYLRNSPPPGARSGVSRGLAR